MVFVDSNVWIGWLNQNDRHHQKASVIFDQFKNEVFIEKIYVTSGIVHDVVNHLFKIKGKETAEKALDLFLTTPSISILFLTDDIWKITIENFYQHTFGLTDAQIVAAMEMTGENTLVSFDQHFDQIPWIKRGSQ